MPAPHPTPIAVMVSFLIAKSVKITEKCGVQTWLPGGGGGEGGALIIFWVSCWLGTKSVTRSQFKDLGPKWVPIVHHYVTEPRPS